VEDARPQKKTPEVIAAIEQLMEYETAGDPMTSLKWTKRTTRKIAAELANLTIHVSHTTVGKLLHRMGYSLRVNQKQLVCGTSAPLPNGVRNQQFEYISQLRGDFTAAGNPVISVDTKKKEMIGNFKNNGRSWNAQPIQVKDHDFRSDAEGMAVPYGIYDTQANRGKIILGMSYDTPAFAVGAIDKWWKTEGNNRYANARELLILADSGGSNGVRPLAWRYHLQDRLCDQHTLKVTVCHYPTGASKWNPIEHRLFSEISKNWAGKPLESYETVLKYIRKTTSSTGLRVSAQLDKKIYRKGETFSKEEMNQLSLVRHETLPKWNYSLSPRR
jgi:hypothetical protein